VCETQQLAELWCTDISQLGYYPIYITFSITSLGIKMYQHLCHFLFYFTSEIWHNVNWLTVIHISEM